MDPTMIEPRWWKKKKMLSAALLYIEAHYETPHLHLHEEIKLQQKGWNIGLKVTGVIAQVFMCMVPWDKQFVDRLGDIWIQNKMYKRYLDDFNLHRCDCD